MRLESSSSCERTYELRRHDETKPLSPFQTIRQTLIDADDDETETETALGKKCPLANDPDARHSRQTDMWWIVHIEGGPRRVNHAAVAVGKFIGQGGDR